MTIVCLLLIKSVLLGGLQFSTQLEEAIATTIQNREPYRTRTDVSQFDNVLSYSHATAFAIHVA
jgi:hypothetical protein